MPVDLQLLQFKPGVSRESTKTTNEGNWYDCDKVRFRSGYPTKIGGWVRYSPGIMLGECRNIVEWTTLNQQYLNGLGTNLKYYVLYGSVYWDITPLRIVFNPLVVDPIYTMFSTLTAAISATDRIIPVNNVIASNMALIVPFVVKIDNEYIYVPAVDTVGNTLGIAGSGCIRETINPVPHAIGANVSSSWAVIAAPANGATPQDFLTILNATGPVGGIPAVTLNSNVMVQAADTAYIICDFKVQSTSAAQGGGAAVEAEFEIHSGKAFPGVGRGWGAGYWGINHGWGTPCPAADGGLSLNMRVWSSDNFGQVLIYNPRGGAIYYWDPDTAMTPSGQILQRGVNINTIAGSDTFAPDKCNMVLVTDERHIMALGCNDTIDGTGIPNQTTQLDPMFIAWSDQSNATIWDPQVENLAGNYRLTYGSYIVAVATTRQETLIWTDTALYSMRYLGAPYVYGFNPMNTNVTIVSQYAWATANGQTYWMGNGKFYVYNGSVTTLPCTLRQYVFDDINEGQWQQVYAGTNEEYNEVWWFYCSQDATIIDRYVVYNHLENLWYYGTMSRTAWLDSHILGTPIAAFDVATTLTSGSTTAKAETYQPSNIAPVAPQIYPDDQPIQQMVQHEIGNDDGTISAAVAPINAYIGTGFFDIGSGYHFAFVNRLIPDCDFIGSDTVRNPTPSVDMVLTAQNFPGVGFNTDPMQTTISSVVGAKETVQVYQYTYQSWIRLRGRQLAFRIESNDLGVAWVLGSPKVQIRSDGLR